MNVLASFRLTLILFLTLTFSGCFYPEVASPDYYISDEDRITSPDLAPYSFPPCSISENSLECSYLNYNFDIDKIMKYGKDSIIASESNNPNNKIVIYFRTLLDQNGVYNIANYSKQSLKINEASVKLKGNKFGNTLLENSCSSGKLYFYENLSSVDVVICDGSFDYTLNAKKYKGSFNAHFVIYK